MRIKHSILIPAYNQEKYINDCLDSVINQTEKPFEIIVVDDCSSDKTWENIQEYSMKYPELVKSSRNKVNLGLFQNLNKMKNLPSGDIVSFVACDDMLDRNFIKNINDFLINNEIKNYNEKFLIITNSVLIAGSNTEFINNFQYKEISILKLILYSKIKVWDTGNSSGLFRSMPSFETDIGNNADIYQFIRRVIQCDRVYFLNVKGYYYRKNVGITSATSQRDLNKSYLMVLEKLKNDSDVPLDESDKSYIDFLIELYGYNINPNAKKYFLILIARLFVKLDKDSIYKNIRYYIPYTIKRIIKMFGCFK